jgi:hypothetical protein
MQASVSAGASRRVVIAILLASARQGDQRSTLTDVHVALVLIALPILPISPEIGKVRLHLRPITPSGQTVVS